MKSKPIKPAEAMVLKATLIPDEVIDVFNELITKRITSFGEARILQKDVVSMIVQRLNCTSAEIFANNWLDVEDVYRNEGWKVVYDSPGYNESYEPSFIFSSSKTK